MMRARIPGSLPARLLRSLPLLLLPLLLLGCPQPSDEPAPPATPPPTDTDVANDQDCTADPAWVTSPSEADAAGFTATSNCSFHQWAFQNFLWLTSPAGDETVFEGFADPVDLFIPGGPQEPYPGRAPGQGLKMLARVGKSRTTADIDSVFQAGPGGKALVDQNGEFVYYSNHLNETYWDFAVNDKLYDLGTLRSFPAGTDFPVGSLELKASWRIAEKDGQILIENAADRFYVVSTSVPTVDVDDQGKIYTDDRRMINAKMALVGMHVTGVVKDHPEFLWATFEHVDNAPDCTADPTQPASRQNGPTGLWSFYKPMTPTNACNQFDVNDPKAVANVCLQHPQGGGSDDNMNAVKTLNTNVAALDVPAPFSSYVLGGTVWTNGSVPLNNGAFAPGDTAGTQLGSLDLANTTMETFTQDDNCFACHNGGAHEITTGNTATEVNAKNVNLSHFVVNYQATEQAKSGQ